MKDLKTKAVAAKDNDGGGRNKRCKLLHRPLVVIMALMLLAGLPVTPGMADEVWADENPLVKISQVERATAFAGDTGVSITMEVKNGSNSSVTFQPRLALPGLGDIAEPNPSSSKTTLAAGSSATLVFRVNVSIRAEEDTYSIPVELIEDNGNIIRSGTLYLEVVKKSTSSVPNPSLDIDHKLSPTDKILAGSITDITLTFFNRGNTLVKNAVVTLVMPEGVTVNNGSNSNSMGYLNIGDKKSVTFSLAADEKMDTKNYPFTIKVDFKDQSNASQSVEQTLYIPVKGSGSKTSLSGLSIANINLPKQVLSGEDFTLDFKVVNKGDGDTGQVKVSVEAQSGLVNRSQNAFVENNIASGDSRSYSVTFFTSDKAEETNYTIKLLVEPLSGEGSGVQQYTGVYVKRAVTDADSIKTPQLMVSGYSFGGSFVQAGDEFRLDLELRNTSSAHILRNIKVTLDSGDGTFIPVKSSNSFFIDNIGKSGLANHGMYLSVKPDAEQKTTSVNVAMSYEDLDGNVFTATDVISIPVMQDTRLLVDDIIGPPEMYVGMQNGISVEFYNMGKTKLHNLRINAEGNFDTMESNSYYAGNMEPGSSDSYDFSFIPRETGMLTGNIIFTYEDASGHQQVYEKDFEFQVMEMPVWDEEPWPPEDMNGKGGKIPWVPIGIGAAVLIVAAILLVRRHRKKKMLKEMEINE